MNILRIITGTAQVLYATARDFMPGAAARERKLRDEHLAAQATKDEELDALQIHGAMQDKQRPHDVH